MRIVQIPAVRLWRSRARVLVDMPLEVERVGLFDGEVVIGLLTRRNEWRVILPRVDGLVLAMALEALERAERGRR